MTTKHKSISRKLKEKELCFGGWTSLGHPQVTEMLIRSGVDFIGIDIEHSTINQEQSQRIIAACHAADIECLPRVGSHNQEAIKRLLDSGADGIIVPTVETAAQVQKLIEWTKYPPLGKRGYGIAAAQGYGHDFEAYTSKWNNSSTLIIQIESITAVENIEKLLIFDEIDGVMIGPYDISGSLNIPGQINHEKVKQAAQHVLDACQQYGKVCGTHDSDPTESSIKEAITKGYKFIVLASDIFIFWKWGETTSKLIKNAK